MPNFLPYHPEQAELLPAHVRDVLGADHLCFLLHEVVESWDLQEFVEAYSDAGGQSPYHPRLMVDGEGVVVCFRVECAHHAQTGTARAGRPGLSLSGGRKIGRASCRERV